MFKRPGTNTAALGQQDLPGNTAFSITQKDIVELWQRNYDELNTWSKDELIKYIIGERPLMF